MTSSELEKMVDKNSYQLFLVTCPAGFPFGFFRHPWFVLNNKGILSRYEVFWIPQKIENRWGHLHKDFYPPFQGISQIPFTEKYFWKNLDLRGVVKGEGAQKMIEFIESSPKIYPSIEKYALLGINSNTYVQWVIDHFPESKLTLPWNSPGKGVKLE